MEIFVKRLIAVSCTFALLFSFSSSVLISVWSNVGAWGGNPSPRCFYPGFDFRLRTNEAKCLLKGVDPFKVWHQDVKLPPFYPYNQPKLCDGEHSEPINAYCPWEYAFAIPMACVPQRVMWPIYFVSMLGCLALLFLIAYRKGRAIRGCRADGVLASAVSLLLVTYPVFTNVYVANYALHLMLALALMMICLNRRYDVLAGFCWAIAMCKPNLAVLMAVPLLAKGRWLTCVVAGLTCVLLSVPAAVLCKTSIFTLIMETPAASADIFFGCGTFPYCFCGYLPAGASILIGTMIGLGVCCWMTWLLRHEKDWFGLCLPAIVCSISWSYAATHAHALGWFLFLVLLMELIQRPTSRGLWLLMAFCVLVASRIYRCLYGVATIYGDYVLGFFRHSEEMHRVLDSFNSTLVLTGCVMYCLWRSRNQENNRE